MLRHRNIRHVISRRDSDSLWKPAAAPHNGHHVRMGRDFNAEADGIAHQLRIEGLWKQLKLVPKQRHAPLMPRSQHEPMFRRRERVHGIGVHGIGGGERV